MDRIDRKKVGQDRICTCICKMIATMYYLLRAQSTLFRQEVRPGPSVAV